MPTYQQRILFADRFKEFGLHPKCKKCLTRNNGGCEGPQYNSQIKTFFHCADFKGVN